MLSELANHMDKVIQSSAAQHRAEPFGKVKDMIQSMIERLEDEADAAATKKAYCDKEMAETQASKDDKDDNIEKLNTKVDMLTAESKKLKSEVARLQKELALLLRTQAEMDKLRLDEKATFRKNHPMMEQGLEGIKTALKVLREHYSVGAGESADGAASGIIGMLEVCESDFSKGLAGMMSEEESAQSEYDEATKENEIAKETKTQDVKFKTAEYIGIDKTVTELETDKSGVKEELSAILDYFASIKKECIARPDSYEEKTKRREEELAGLKDALKILDQGSEAEFVQRRSKKVLRGPVRPNPSLDVESSE